MTIFVCPTASHGVPWSSLIKVEAEKYGLVPPKKEILHRKILGLSVQIYKKEKEKNCKSASVFQVPIIHANSSSTEETN